jgi:flagellar basal body-associated protein FliL
MSNKSKEDSMGVLIGVLAVVGLVALVIIIVRLVK